MRKKTMKKKFEEIIINEKKIESRRPQVHSPLRLAMIKLDEAIPDYVFDSDEGIEISKHLNEVYDAIEIIEEVLKHAMDEKKFKKLMAIKIGDIE